ncbi:sigma-70 family RNA polymerase sigma factor [Pseudonocardia hydrocarbonoxydans]|uniref:Putative RNA polymerase sigma-D factor n=1 Tax=Pseudonocardia hydrocarbonoxydans TaxID=76726 RepID=A0A4Y3WQT8_9PSEU|nr:sigma-70 family RNA polymerase sigma factor [Pseudonocardia hydrocarbonoxydans]GEC20641.1 putative RNA polymerase sigma-D factor [Pseudonocardia hydrocarbonoxydans]
MHDDDPPDPDGEGDDLDGLARRAGGGDRAALDTFLRLVQPPVVRYCRSRLVGAHAALGPDDVAQEVLLAVCHALPRFRSDGQTSAMAFVFGIARNKIVDGFRYAGRDRSVARDVLPDDADDAPGPEAAAVLSTEIARLRWALDQLLPQHREVLGLRIGLSYTAEEVGQLIGSSPGAVRVTQHRALQRIRLLLAEESAN